jgi:erythronate-4-phosphate dehydrogenase
MCLESSENLLISESYVQSPKFWLKYERFGSFADKQIGLIMKIIADTNIPFVEECFSSVGEVKVVNGREITPAVVADADALIVRSVTRVDSDLLSKSRVRFVGTATIGFDHIDTDYLTQRNIGFASAPGSNANSAAEYVIAALLEIGQKHKINLNGKSIGIIGVGNVGSRVAKKAAALGMKVKLNDPPLQRKTNDSKYLQIEELFDCDFLTLHTPLTFDGVDRTFHLADDKFFQSLKQKCVFINASRGSVVDSIALKAAIKSRQLKAEALDVWEDEPDIDTELLEMVDIGTPHIAGYSLDGKINGMIMVYKALCDYFNLEPKYDIHDFLPEPIVPELTINPYDGDEQEVLRNAVRKIYNVTEDDCNLRKIIEEPAGKRGKFFDSLRKNYPVRREIQNTQIILESPCQSIAEKLAGIGYKVADE